MLAARDWNNPDIAEHLHISVATVKRHLSVAMKKLGVARRGDLEQFMLK
ncbi:helix-turn-helix transcriptional regulator [Flintibacter sp. KGMB00164]|nr:helix-turn-helix transcriptional regulator [Flintibacter sp. KGMB00164]